MVLHSPGCGRVGRRRNIIHEEPPREGWLFVVPGQCTRPSPTRTRPEPQRVRTRSSPGPGPARPRKPGVRADVTYDDDVARTHACDGRPDRRSPASPSPHDGFLRPVVRVDIGTCSQRSRRRPAISTRTTGVGGSASGADRCRRQPHVTGWREPERDGSEASPLPVAEGGAGTRPRCARCRRCPRREAVTWTGSRRAEGGGARVGATPWWLAVQRAAAARAAAARAASGVRPGRSTGRRAGGPARSRRTRGRGGARVAPRPGRGCRHPSRRTPRRRC